MKKVIPIISIIAALVFQIFMPNSTMHPVVKASYFTYVLFIGLAAYLVLFVITFFNENLNEKINHRAYFIGGAVLFFNILNIVTVKLGVLPVLYFPSLDRVFGVLVEDRVILSKCLAYSARLLVYGYFSGALVGVVTGICLGFSKQFNYWLSPVVRILGPIPSTAWIPLVLVCFPTAISASAFLVALAVWFPTTIMTSSGISNIKNSYFEVSSTLGANTFHRIFKVGVPAAAPHIFLGLFNGTTASFTTLVTAEMIGAKYGIGWYVNWQKELLSYANVYAGLLIIAIVFSILITLFFKFRDRILVWQKGVIKW